MSEDQNDNVPKKENQQTYSRKNVLKLGAGLAATVIAAGVAVKRSSDLDRQKQQEEKAFLARKTIGTPTPVPQSLPENIMPSPKIGSFGNEQRTKTPTPAKEENSRLTPEELYFQLVFPDYSLSQRKLIGADVLRQIIHYNKDSQLVHQVRNTNHWEGVIQQVSQRLNLEGSFAAEVLSDLIFVESKGDPKAQSTAGGKGLCQLTDVAVDTVKKFSNAREKFFGGNFEVNLLDNHEANIAIGLGYLDHLYRIFPERSLALWAYHLGEGNMGLALRTHCIQDLHMEPSYVDGFLDDRMRAGSAELINAVNGKTPGMLSFLTVFSSENVISALQKNPMGQAALANDTGLYVPRIAAAQFIRQSELAYEKSGVNFETGMKQAISEEEKKFATVS